MTERVARARESGMTLIEVLIALLILSVGASSLIALFASASSTHKRAVDRTHAALIAEEIFSEIQARYVAGVDLNDVASDLRSTLPEQIDGYFWEVKLHLPGAQEGPDVRSSSRRRGLMLTESPSSWGEDELVVYLRIKSSRAIGAHEETYATILLPRPAGGG